jgi:hypothetical protein
MMMMMMIWMLMIWMLMIWMLMRHVSHPSRTMMIDINLDWQRNETDEQPNTR